MSVCLFSQAVSHFQPFVFCAKSLVMRILTSFLTSSMSFYYSVQNFMMLLSFSYCCLEVKEKATPVRLQTSVKHFLKSTEIHFDVKMATMNPQHSIF